MTKSTTGSEQAKKWYCYIPLLCKTQASSPDLSPAKSPSPTPSASPSPSPTPCTNAEPSLRVKSQTLHIPGEFQHEIYLLKTTLEASDKDSGLLKIYELGNCKGTEVPILHLIARDDDLTRNMPEGTKKCPETFEFVVTDNSAIKKIDNTHCFVITDCEKCEVYNRCCKSIRIFKENLPPFGKREWDMPIENAYQIIPCSAALKKAVGIPADKECVKMRTEFG